MSLRNNPLEQKIYEDFGNNSQNTHKVEVETSVAMLLIHLSKTYFSHGPTRKIYLSQEVANFSHIYRGDHKELQTYFPDTLEEKIDYKIIKTPINDYFTKTMTEMEQLAKNDSEIAAIHFIKNRASEPINMVRDRVVTYDAKTENSEHDDIFPLKHVLVLVWKAVNDDKKFLHCFQGPDEEKLHQAITDRSNRINNLFSIFKQLYAEQLCGTGNRNEITWSINGYEGIYLFEDARAVVMTFLKDYIQENFWKFYDGANEENKKALHQAMIEWMDEGNAQTILKLIDPNDIAEKKISDYFISHGCNPEKFNLKQKIYQEALPNLYFSTDSLKYPLLHKASEILKLPEEIKEHTARGSAILKIQEWIKQDLVHALQDDSINYIYAMIFTNFSLQWEKHKSLLELHGFADEAEHFKNLPQLQRDFFANCNSEAFPRIIPETQQLIDKFSIVIKKICTDGLVDTFENFFKHWFLAHKNLDRDENTDYNQEIIVRLYKLLHEPLAQSKIIFTDEQLKIIIKDNSLDNAVHVTPYLINRILLQAIIQPRDKWSSTFKEAFDYVVSFIDNGFNNEEKSQNTLIQQSLKKGSYPQELLDQLHFYQGKEIYRPEKMILHLSSVSAFADWQGIVKTIGLNHLVPYYPEILERIKPQSLIMFTNDSIQTSFKKYVPKQYWYLTALNWINNLPARIFFKLLNNMSFYALCADFSIGEIEEINRAINNRKPSCVETLADTFAKCWEHKTVEANFPGKSEDWILILKRIYEKKPELLEDVLLGLKELMKSTVIYPKCFYDFFDSKITKAILVYKKPFKNPEAIRKILFAYVKHYDKDTIQPDHFELLRVATLADPSAETWTLLAEFYLKIEKEIEAINAYINCIMVGNVINPSHTHTSIRALIKLQAKYSKESCPEIHTSLQKCYQELATAIIKKILNNERNPQRELFYNLIANPEIKEKI